jgi:hypothetical protein
VNIAPPPGSLRPEQHAQPPPQVNLRAGAGGRGQGRAETEMESPARTLLARIAGVLLGKTLTLVLAALAFGIGLATRLPRPRFAVPKLASRSGSCSATLGSCCLARSGGATGRAFTERRRSAGSRLHATGPAARGVAAAPTIVVACFRRRLFPFWHPACPTTRCARRSTSHPGFARLSGRAPQHSPVALEMAND